MANVAYIGNAGGATAVAQVDTFTPANVEVDDIFTLTATGEDGTTNAVSFTATATTAANVAAGLVAAWNASTHRLCTPITASGSSTVILTADTAGVPFSVASSTTDGGGNNNQTLTRAATTANVGASDAGLAANYYNNALPGNSGDTLAVDGRNAAAIAYGLNLSAKTLDVLNVTMANSYNIGSTAAYLRISATVANIGLPAGDGSSPSGPALIAIDTGTNATTFNVWNSNRTGTNSLPTVNWKGAHSSNTVNVFGGVFGAATLLPGDTATIPYFNQFDGTATLASGVTVATVKQDGGTLYLKCGATTVTQDSGTMEHDSTATITTLNVGGAVEKIQGGTITTMKVRAGGSFKYSGSTSLTFTNAVELYPGATLDVDNGLTGTVTFSGGISLIGCDFGQVTIKTPKHVTIGSIGAGS